METAGESTTGTPTDPSRLDGSRRPGWFPDESRPDRFRHWDGGSWNAMTAATPVWGPEGEPRDRAGVARSRTIRGVVAVAAALVLIAGAGFVVNAGSDDEVAADRTSADDDDTEVMSDRLERDDENGDAGDGDGSNGDGSNGDGSNGDGSNGGGNADPDGSNGGSGSNGGGSGSGGSGSSDGGSSDGATSGGAGGGSNGSGGSGGGSGGTGDASGPGGGSGGGGAPVGSPSPDRGDGGGPADLEACESLGAELQATLRSFPGLESVSRTMTIDDVRCNARWASGNATSVVTPRSLAVFERQDGRWVLVAYGTDNPCRELALSAPLAEQLRCG